MVTSRSIVALALIAVGVNFLTSAAALGGSRVFLSAAAGNDANPNCTPLAPCRNLPRGRAVVTPGGSCASLANDAPFSSKPRCACCGCG